MNNHIFRSSLPAFLLAAIILIPFLDKAFTIDDTVFLLEAQHALTDPLHPTAFELTWERTPERVSRLVPTGPVMAWLLIPSILAGGEEWVAHAVQLILLWIAILATVSLALRLGLTPGWATVSGLLLVGTPAVLGLAGTAMPDVPAMALGIAGIERIVAWRDDRKVHQGIVAAVLLGFAPHTRTHLVLLFGVAAFVLVGNLFSRSDWRGLWKRGAPLAAAPLIMAAVAALTRDPGPGAGSVIEALSNFSSTAAVSTNIAAFAIHWVLALSFALPWLALRWRAILKRIWLFAFACVTAALLLIKANHGDISYSLAAIAALGVVSLVDVLLDAFRRRDSVQLALGIWLLLSLPAILYVHLPSKYLVPSAPAAAILLARAASERSRHAIYLLGLSLLTGVLLGAAILRADATFSEVSRVAAQKLIAPQVEAGRNVWYVGVWGFKWYAEKAGARCYSNIPPYPAIGDLLVFHSNRSNPFSRGNLEGFTLLAKVDDREPGGRIMSKNAGAGFYSNDWGYLPWAWSDDVNDAVELWLITPRQQSFDLAPRVRDGP